MLSSPVMRLHVVFPVTDEYATEDALFDAARKQLAHLVSPGQVIHSKFSIEFLPNEEMAVIADVPFAVSMIGKYRPKKRMGNLDEKAGEIRYLASRGYSDGQIAASIGASREGVNGWRKRNNVPAGWHLHRVKGGV